MLQTAAVIGKEFPLAVLQKIVPYAKAELRAALKVLSDTQLLSPARTRRQEPLYAFRHSPTQEAAYRTQLVPRRQQIHAEVARIIEELHPGADEQAALIAHHRESAGDERAAADWYTRAARWVGSTTLPKHTATGRRYARFSPATTALPTRFRCACWRRFRC